MAYGTKVQFEPIRQIANGAIAESYSPIGTPFIDHCRLMRIVSTLNEEVYISIDGINDHIRMANNSFFIMDFTTNKVQDDGLFLSVGTVIYVRQADGIPMSGNVWIEVLYADGGV